MSDGKRYVIPPAPQAALAVAGSADRVLYGSDYPHNDPSREDQFVNALNIREDLTPQLRQKILYENPRRFYALAD
jgi:predicted TIM-barrel fold metal-dependent hydrolase